MDKNILTSYGIKKMIEGIWKSNDIEVTAVEYGIASTRMCVEYLDTKFYCFKTRKPTSRSYALVEVVNDNSILIPNTEYCEKTAKITFIISEEKADILDYYIQKLRIKYLGASQSFDLQDIKFDAYLEFGALSYDEQPKVTPLSDSVICSLNLKITYTTNILTSNNKVWLLDGVILPYLTESIDLEKTGSSNNIYGAKATQTLPTTQSKYYRFTLPYVTDNAACVQIQREILAGDMTQEHTLSYYDGITYMQDAPYTAKVTLYRTNRNSARVAANSELEIIFAEADDQSKSRVKYEMALIDNPFDSGSVNTRWFASIEEQQAWFNAKVQPTQAPYVAIKAPNLSSMIVTSQTYFAPVTVDLNTLLTKNYAIVRATDNNIVKYYYYFVQSASAGADNQILVSLQMDTVQTYYFNPDIDIAPCVINRAHLNRWVNNNDGTVKFDGTPSSALFKREHYQGLATRLVKRTPVYLCVDENSKYDSSGDFVLSPLDQWLKDNVSYWVYVYCTPANDALIHNWRNTLKNQNIYSGLACFCYPLYKRNAWLRTTTVFNAGSASAPVYKIEDVTEAATAMDEYTFWRAIEANDKKNEDNYPNSSHILIIKTSCRPPFNVGNYLNKKTNTDDGLAGNGRYYFFGTTSSGSSLLTIQIGYTSLAAEAAPSFGYFGGLSRYVFIETGDVQHQGYSERQSPRLFEMRFSYSDYFLSDAYTVSKQSSINLKEIYNSKRGAHYNPKSLGSDFYQLSLEGADGQKFDYDLQKLNMESFRLRYTEVLLPDITRGYLRIEPKSDSSYSSETVNDFTGLVFSMDNSLMFTSSKWSEFLASNKNFFMQTQMQKDYSTKQAVVNTIFGATNNLAGFAGNSGAGNAVGATGNVLGLGSTLANSAMAFEGINLNNKLQMLSIDNIKSAPNNVKNASGNSLFISAISGQRLHICEYECLEDELIEADDDMYLNGYTCNKIGKIKDFDNTRKYFNFIQASIENIGGLSLSSEAQYDLRNRFARGVRFWNSDTIQYELENYERWLENYCVVNIVSEGGGSTSPSGQFSVVAGSKITVTATPDSNKRFVRFTVAGALNYEINPLTITVSGHTEIIARFMSDGAIEF